ncbi:oxidoreductase [Devosia insulae DS-56]|uniref:Oxidoreductase n=1 Tax=Devosia insulae DS-56 TaxID=1116389 RepID=A0A1E5XR34_9HYPH|nr:ferredoxin reductase [Devosia insulae]OEO31049.1 oxidoreductase [Devosia insulae DS-56]
MNLPLQWQLATIAAVRSETPEVKTFSLHLPDWMRHRAGQHYDLRLRAADGYEAQRSYSIASAPETEGQVQLTIEKINDGEVSSFLHEVAVVGDRIEVRGPIGGYFVWEAALGGPLLLIGGGSGVVPLMAMLRHRAAAGSRVPTRLLLSARSYDDLIYREELDALAADGSGFEVFYTLTRSQPSDWHGYSRRIDAAMLATVAGPLGRTPLCYICGPTLLVEAAANGLAEIGVPANRIRTERFGPSGS